MRDRIVTAIPKSWRPTTRQAWHLLRPRKLQWAIELLMRAAGRRNRTLSGLLQRKMAQDRRPVLTTVADKLAVRTYIEGLIGIGYLPRLLDSAETPDGIAWSELPAEYVAKVNHGSGGMVMICEDADPASSLPDPSVRQRWTAYRVRPEQADPRHIAILMEGWLAMDYSRTRGGRVIEWCYEDIPRRILVEELLRGSNGLPPREYRLFVIGGKVRFLQVEVTEGAVACTAVMSPEWDWIPARFLNPLPTEVPYRPALLGQMLEIAEALAHPIGDFLRVDLYDLGSRIVVGELTNYPYGGHIPVRPHSYDRAWAAHWPKSTPLCDAGRRR